MGHTGNRTKLKQGSTRSVELPEVEHRMSSGAQRPGHCSYKQGSTRSVELPEVEHRMSSGAG